MLTGTLALSRWWYQSQPQPGHAAVAWHGDSHPLLQSPSPGARFPQHAVPSEHAELFELQPLTQASSDQCVPAALPSKPTKPCPGPPHAAVLYLLG